MGEGTGTTGAPVPSPAVSGSIQLSGTAGTVFLANQATALTCPPTGSLTGNPAVLDLVGYGTSNTFEKAPAPATSASTAAERAAAGTDTDDNSTDFKTSAGSPGVAPAGGPTDPPDDPPTTQTIEEIQGTGDTSPFAGKAVTTEGVVTAAYPTGGFNGFYLQTAGTGGDVDPATHQASDAVFVFGSAVSKAVHIGDHVQVTGKVSEFQGTTEITRRRRCEGAPRSRLGAARVRRTPADGCRARVVRRHAAGAGRSLHGRRQLRAEPVRRDRPRRRYRAAVQLTEVADLLDAAVSQRGPGRERGARRSPSTTP